jgi:hypothetical protein
MGRWIRITSVTHSNFWRVGPALWTSESKEENLLSGRNGEESFQTLKRSNGIEFTKLFFRKECCIKVYLLLVLHKGRPLSHYGMSFPKIIVQVCITNYREEMVTFLFIFNCHLENSSRCGRYLKNSDGNFASKSVLALSILVTSSIANTNSAFFSYRSPFPPKDQMASKRSWQGLTSRSKPYYAKRTRQPDPPAEANEVPASSSSFQTPAPRSMPQLDHSIPGQFLSRSPLSHTSIASPLSTTHLSTQKRVSLRPLRSQSHSNQDPSPGHDEVGEIESDTDIQRREDADAMNEVIMAIDMKNRGTLGCAFYIAREEKLCLMEDIKMAGQDIVDTLKLHVQPTVILISSRAEEDLEDHLSKEARPMGKDNRDS